MEKSSFYIIDLFIPASNEPGAGMLSFPYLANAARVKHLLLVFDYAPYCL